jgi:RNA polymerase sigma-70 factor, ECF subfamily
VPSEKRRRPTPAELRALLISARSGDPDAAARVLEVFRPYLIVRSYANIDRRLQLKVAPSDAAQETLIRALNGFHRFTGNSAASLLRWLDRIHGRFLVDVHRRFLAKKRDVREERSLTAARSRRLASCLANMVATNPTPSESLALKLDLQFLRSAIAQLPVRQREALELRFIDGCSSAEIAARLGISASGARWACIRALESLGKLLNKRK